MQPAAQRDCLPRDNQQRPALRAAAAGCAPFNPFGTANTSQASLDYVSHADRDIGISQHAVSANGDSWPTRAGPLAVAAGVEYRKDATSVLHDPLSNVFAYFQNFGADYTGDQEVYEGYVGRNCRC
jgi:hypothetical protein